MYFEPCTNSPPLGQHSVSAEMELSNDTNNVINVSNISVDQLHLDESQSISVDRSSFEVQSTSFSSPVGYWTGEQTFCPPLAAYQNSQMINGEMGPMTLYFSSPYPYQVNH